ncbi:MAG: metallophosphoesterase, partial [Pseudomonadota bacterium]
MSRYHIIGDIHGHADKLEELLLHLGYQNSSGVYRHADAKAVFLGDFIDRGSQHRRVIGIVR